MRTIPVILIGLLSGLSYAQPSGEGRPIETAPTDVVDCSRVPGLKEPILEQMGPSVVCRLEIRDLACTPGLTVKTDVTGKLDLCVNKNGRPLGEPTCTTKHRKRYVQEIIQRGQFVVERPAQKPAKEWLDLPFTMSSRMEVLAQRKPSVLNGPDACVYLRHTLLLLGKQKPKQSPPSPSK